MAKSKEPPLNHGIYWSAACNPLKTTDGHFHCTKIVSFAPLLGPIGFDLPGVPHIGAFDWVLVEAESQGPHPGRHCDFHWVQDIVMQADCYDLPVYVKQIHQGPRLVRNWAALPHGLARRAFPVWWTHTATKAGLLAQQPPADERSLLL